MIVELAERAHATVDEFRARLNDAQIGASGHGLAWEGQARSLADQMRIEKQGVLPGQVVQPFAANDDDTKISTAERALNERLQKAFAEFPQTGLQSGAEREIIRRTKFKVWYERGAYAGPLGEFNGMGWKIMISIAADSHPKAREIIESLPDQFENFDLVFDDSNLKQETI